MTCDDTFGAKLPRDVHVSLNRGWTCKHATAGASAWVVCWVMLTLPFAFL
jgi:hypothetical protein